MTSTWAKGVLVIRPDQLSPTESREFLSQQASPERGKKGAQGMAGGRKKAHESMAG